MKASRLDIVNPVHPDAAESLRREVIVVSDSCDAAFRRGICQFIEEQPKRPLTVGAYGAGGAAAGVQTFVDANVRHCDTVDLTLIATSVNRVIGAIVATVIEPNFRTAIDYWSPPTALAYPVGGRNDCHFDNELPDPQADGTISWKRVNDRDFSLVWYLNNDYEGGQLTFPFIGITVTPQEGMVVCFPSHHLFAHGAEVVTAGLRLAIVSWATKVGTPRPPEAPSIVVLNPTPGRRRS
jgi:predicted 2-oxoglutarate/Fe(II)-dependent dioxygenase YbiX